MALGTGRAVGYEALARFAEGIAPDQLITDAHATGLGADLELACLAAALDAAEALDPACWLSLNVSPSVIVNSPALTRLLANRRRRLVLEHGMIGLPVRSAAVTKPPRPKRCSL